jgi:3-deoxy-D-manno-octulosonic-acid transferase
MLVQSPQDRERIQALGVEPDRVVDLGSAKYDVAEENAEETTGMRRFLDAIGWKDTLILTGGSTWSGEEDILLDIYRRLRGTNPSLRLALAPRHAERGDEVANLIQKAGFPLMRRSRWTTDDALKESPEVLLLDTTGELRSLYACSDLIFVGKSLTNHGGQNIIEPALLAKPVVVGPNMENFPVVIRDFTDAGGLLQVQDAEGLAQTARRLLKDPDLRKTLGTRARQVVESHRGVVAESVRRIVEMADRL